MVDFNSLKSRALSVFKKKKAEDADSVHSIEEGRETWGSGIDFFMSALGYAVGIGNVWRFPYLCYKNGGGTFLIPYFLFMLLLAIPMVYLEFIVGQFTSTGLLTAYKMVPISRGIGISMNIANCYLCIFYNMLIAYSLYFMVMSFRSVLPWQKCNPVWASPNCVDNFDPSVFKFNKCTDNSTLFKCDIKNTVNFGKCFNLTDTIGLSNPCNEGNSSILEKIGYWKAEFPSQDYWNKVILNKSSGIDEPGTIIWQLLIALFGAYLIVYLMLVRGVKVSGKLVWFTALFPYVVLLTLGIRGWLLPGAGKGISYYITPNWSRLADLTVWTDAATQIFFSTSISYGGMVTLASYNKFNSNVLRNAVVIPLANSLTSFFAGFVIFSYMGYLSEITGQEIADFIQAGQGLAFVVYPFAVTTIAGAPFWSVAFFFMMILLGIDSALANFEIAISSVTSYFPWVASTKWKKFITFNCIFVFFYLLGLTFCFQSGTYWVEIINTYSGGWSILLIGATELFVCSWLYGLKNLRRDIIVMMGPKIGNKYLFALFAVLWGFISPALCLALTVITLVNATKIVVGDYEFPDWTHVIGMLLSASMYSGVVFYAIYAIINALFFNKKPFLSLFKPDFENYIPDKTDNQRLVRIARGFEVDEKMDMEFNNETFKKDAERF